jgi:hypothetical protein
MSNQYVIYRVSGKDPDCMNRKFQLNQGLTMIMHEEFRSSGKRVEVGDRPMEFVRVESDHDPSFHGWSTHYKTGDWVVDRIEEYPANMPGLQDFDEIVICYCKYSPIESELRPMPARIVSLESFDGDQEAFDLWQASQKEPVSV